MLSSQANDYGEPAGEELPSPHSTKMAAYMADAIEELERTYAVRLPRIPGAGASKAASGRPKRSSHNQNQQALPPLAKGSPQQPKKQNKQQQQQQQQQQQLVPYSKRSHHLVPVHNRGGRVSSARRKAAQPTDFGTALRYLEVLEESQRSAIKFDECRYSQRLYEWREDGLQAIATRQSERCELLWILFDEQQADMRKMEHRDRYNITFRESNEFDVMMKALATTQVEHQERRAIVDTEQDKFRLILNADRYDRRLQQLLADAREPVEICDCKTNHAIHECRRQEARDLIFSVLPDCSSDDEDDTRPTTDRYGGSELLKSPPPPPPPQVEEAQQPVAQPSSSASHSPESEPVAQPPPSQPQHSEAEVSHEYRRDLARSLVESVLLPYAGEADGGCCCQDRAAVHDCRRHQAHDLVEEVLREYLP